VAETMVKLLQKNERQYEWVVLPAVIPIFQGGQGSQSSMKM